MLHPLRENLRDDPSRTPQAQRQPPPMDHRVGGRKSSQYSPAMARIILARIEGGESVASLLADPDMPSRRTLYDWINNHGDFAAAWDQMRRDQARHRRSEVDRLEQGVRRWAAIHARTEDRAPRAKAGRKSTWTPQRGRAFCRVIRKGGTTREAARAAAIGSPLTVYNWLRNHPEFRAHYVAACKQRHRDLWMRREMALDRAAPDDLAAYARFKPVVERIEGRMGALMPDVWRWD